MHIIILLCLDIQYRRIDYSLVCGMLENLQFTVQEIEGLYIIKILE